MIKVTKEIKNFKWNCRFEPHFLLNNRNLCNFLLVEEELVYGKINNKSYPYPMAVTDKETKEEKELNKLIKSMPKRKQKGEK